MNIEASGQRIEELLDRIAQTEPQAAELAEALVRELVSLYGAGLERILDRLRSAAPAALTGLAEDPLVAGLMVLHDLHPDDVKTRVEAALDTVRPYLASHGGGVQLLEVENGIVRLRLEGNCDGCSASMLTLRHAVEEAVRKNAPEIERIEAEEATAPAHPPPGAPAHPPPGAPAHPPPGAPGVAASGLIPAESLLVRPTGAVR